jgi:hypothetical protein
MIRLSELILPPCAAIGKPGPSSLERVLIDLPLKGLARNHPLIGQIAGIVNRRDSMCGPAVRYKTILSSWDRQQSLPRRGVGTDRYFTTNAATPLSASQRATGIPSLRSDTKYLPPPGTMTTAAPLAFPA